MCAAAAKFNGWIDFLDKASAATLVKSATYSDQYVGGYETVIVHFYRAFKINAEVPLNNGTTLYTKATENFQSNNKAGLDVTYANISENLTKAPSEDAVFFLPNGGKTFHLQSPFQITAADVAAKTSFKMVLAYESTNIIKGHSVPTGPATGEFLTGQRDSVNGYAIEAPFMEFAPVLARSSETIIKESYLLHSKAPAVKNTAAFLPQSAYSVRVTLYSAKEDPTNTIRGVTTALVYGADTDDYVQYNTLAGVKKVTTNADGTLDFVQGASNLVALKGSKRLTAKNVVENVTGAICTGGSVVGGCEAGKEGTLNFTYTLLGSGPADEALPVQYITPVPSATPVATP